ncbi:MAG: ribonuclease J [Ruminococcaceae bacterium]|nr:ribonuclease J [Oscillospiraceae bacterium]
MKKKNNRITPKLRVMALGGLNEIGKNMTVLECGEDIIIIDCGLGFPDDDMLGIDLVIPDISYLEQNVKKIRGIFLTHGHEDHIGALPYVLRNLDVPVYGTRLTLGIVRYKLEEHGLSSTALLNTVTAGDKIKAGCFEIEFIHVNHSIADACCLAIKTPVGNVVHSGDFKLDLTPVDGGMMDLTRLGEIGREGVTLLMCESTNVEQPGFTPSERLVGRSFENIFMQNSDKRIVVATFSSNVHRVQQIINTSARYNRKVAITGRSMLNIVKAAVDLGYMSFPKGVLIDINELSRYPKNQTTIITTGSQGEPMSALHRMTFGGHDKISLGMEDLVVISAHAIPGNEKLVGNIINELMRNGVSVFHDRVVEVHVSGHAREQEIKLMHALIKPKYFVPVHGEFKHLMRHKELAMSMGEKEESIFVMEIGQMLEIDENSAKINGMVPAGKVLVDGYGVGDIGNIVLRDRKLLSQDGIIIVVATVDINGLNLVSGPDVVSRGFVYVRESEALMEGARNIAYQALMYCLDNGVTEWNQLKNRVRDDLSKYLYAQTKRKPMILPIIMNV